MEGRREGFSDDGHSEQRLGMGCEVTTGKATKREVGAMRRDVQG